jgi:hypothetical protein
MMVKVKVMVEGDRNKKLKIHWKKAYVFEFWPAQPHNRDTLD